MIDWERRKAEDAEIAEQLEKLSKAGEGFQRSYPTGYAYAGMLLTPLYNCTDGKVRGVSSVALKRGEFGLREGMTFRAGELGGKEDIRPLGSTDIGNVARIAALFVGGPVGAVLGAIGNAPVPQGNIPVKRPEDLTVGELLALVRGGR